MSNCKGIYGDVNGDGIVSIVDAMYVAQYLEGTRTLTACQLIAADVDGDGIITSTDAQYIGNYTVLTKPYGKCGKLFGEITDETPPDKYYDCVDNICKEVVSGQYKNDPKCAGKCKKETKFEMGNTILIVLGAGIGLGILYYLTKKK